MLRERRGERGSLLMSIPEAEVVLDERGWPVEVKRVDHLLSHQIIEEFMIAANEAVGRFIGEPCLFRVHTTGPRPSRWRPSGPLCGGWALTCPSRPIGTPGSSRSSWRRCGRRPWPPRYSSCCCGP
ncbi:MAG: RNB domain-containing ribonuclease [Deltaproteobacteria bacterium]|nr:RNB domain-containing ribonuclease [Deltaproteobacteria bacterium]